MHKIYFEPKLTGRLCIQTTSYTVPKKHVTFSRKLIMTIWQITRLWCTNMANSNVLILIVITWDIHRKMWINIEKCTRCLPIKPFFTNVKNLIAILVFLDRHCWIITCVSIITIWTSVSIAPSVMWIGITIALISRIILESRILNVINVTKNSQPQIS